MSSKSSALASICPLRVRVAWWCLHTGIVRHACVCVKHVRVLHGGHSNHHCGPGGDARDAGGGPRGAVAPGVRTRNTAESCFRQQSWTSAGISEEGRLNDLGRVPQ